MRSCGSGSNKCQLCCKLLPMQKGLKVEVAHSAEVMAEHGLLSRDDLKKMLPDFHKPAGKRCPHQVFGKGCKVYERRPFGCRMWSCRWLTEDDTAELNRPDRSHYVVDLVADFITYESDSEGKITIPVMQIWIDRGYPNAHRDPALRSYLIRRAEEGYAALIRFDADEAMLLIAPPLAHDGKWHELTTNAKSGAEHTLLDKIAAIGREKALG